MARSECAHGYAARPAFFVVWGALVAIAIVVVSVAAVWPRVRPSETRPLRLSIVHGVALHRGVNRTT